jgi:hypothetical protein
MSLKQMWRNIMMTNRWIAAVLVGLMVGRSAPGLSQAGVSADPSCKTLMAPIFDLSGHFVPGGRVTSCSTSTVDTTEGPNALKRDEVLSISRGRYSQRQPFLLRGHPNTPYLAPAIHTADVAAAYTADPAYYPLSTSAQALPFVPRRAISLGDLGDGHDWYGYTELQFLPSHANDALPLNANSVVVAVDGYSFRTPNALLGLLSKLDGLGQNRRYVEVVYLQPGEATPHLHRALIPLSVRSQLEPEWSTLASRSTSFAVAPRSKAGEALVMFTLMMTALEMFKESPTGQAWERDHQACLAERSGTLGAFGC